MTIRRSHANQSAVPPAQGASPRAYDAIIARIPAGWRTDPARDDAQRLVRMQVVSDLLWDALHPTGVSWAGFYSAEPGDDQMILRARRDKPACSPIGLHGACGQCFLSRKPLVVRDVKDLGEHYVACDPRDRSEVVVPCLNADGSCWGVLDLDSWDVGSFSDADARGLAQALVAAGLSAR